MTLESAPVNAVGGMSNDSSPHSTRSELAVGPGRLHLRLNQDDRRPRGAVERTEQVRVFLGAGDQIVESNSGAVRLVLTAWIA